MLVLLLKTPSACAGLWVEVQTQQSPLAVGLAAALAPAASASTLAAYIC